jgi:hypothetical protein
MSEDSTNQETLAIDSQQDDRASTQTVPMVLITLPQRAALIEFMAKQPYADVANGIEFLRTAPQVNVSITAPESAGLADFTDSRVAD